jgi:hypothetical protein
VFALLVSVLVAVGLGGLAYLGAAKLLKVEELGTALRLLRRQREPSPPPPDPDEGLA